MNRVLLSSINNKLLHQGLTNSKIFYRQLLIQDLSMQLPRREDQPQQLHHRQLLCSTQQQHLILMSAQVEAHVAAVAPNLVAHVLLLLLVRLRKL